MKKQNNFIYLRITVLLILILTFLISATLWWIDGLKPVDINDNSVINFTVAKGEGVKSIIGKLYQEKLINSQTAFYIFLKIYSYDRKLQAGDFRLSKSMAAETVAKELTHGVSDKWVTIVEGLRREEVATLLSDQFSIPESEFLKISKEGYIFPDTYAIPQDATAGAIINLISTNFNRKVQPLLDEYSGPLTKDEVIILASVVEREGKNDEDRKAIAGILLNRLEQDWPLQADATIQYALGYQPKEKDWWKFSLYNEDKEVDSPYNTYKFKGLPIGPIASPGISAISAVINPVDTEYFYYLHDNQGNIHFGKTLEDHNRNIDIFLRF